MVKRGHPMTIEKFLLRLEGVRRSSRGYMARCPAHEDHSPSLGICQGERGLLVKCWAGCTLDEIAAAIGIRVADLFFDAPAPHGQRPRTKPVRIDRVAVAFRFELAALDRRLRAERVFLAVNGISINDLSDNDLNRLVVAVGRAYADIEHADLFETVGDDLRLKDFALLERRDRHAA
jgi:hypothetical protein